VHWANKDEIFLLQQTHADGESPRNTNLYDKVRKASVFVKANLDDDDDDDDNEDRDPQFDYEDATSDCDTDSQIDGSPRSPERTAVATFSIGLKQRNAQAQESTEGISFAVGKPKTADNAQVANVVEDGMMFSVGKKKEKGVVDTGVALSVGKNKAESKDAEVVDSGIAFAVGGRKDKGIVESGVAFSIGKSKDREDGVVESGVAFAVGKK
jgi:hypothetical protein